MSKSITITNGSGSENILNGVYSVTLESNGYDNTTISPNSVTVVEGTNEYAFTVAATGTLTVHVTEDGTSGGTPVVGAKFIRTDASGLTYGNEITTDVSGNAIFNNVPFASSDAPNVYFKQTASDGDHEYSTDIVTTTLTAQTVTYEVTNAKGALRTITLTDSNYNSLPIGTATITLN